MIVLIELILSNYINSYLFTLTAIIVIYPYIKTNKKYYIMCLVIGLLYDIVIANTLFINCILFFNVGFVVNILNKYFPQNKINNTVHITISLTVYIFEMYMLTMCKISFINVIITIIINLMYGFILELIFEKVKKRYKF